jgi:hypothetical protein
MSGERGHCVPLRSDVGRHADRSSLDGAGCLEKMGGKRVVVKVQRLGLKELFTWSSRMSERRDHFAVVAGLGSDVPLSSS